MRKPDFYLYSSEGYNLQSPRQCFIVKNLSYNAKHDCMLVHISPCIVGQQYGLGSNDVDQLLIAARHVGVSLLEIKEWPVYVYVFRILVDAPDTRDTLRENEVELIGWAELYRTLQDTNEAICAST